MGPHDPANATLNRSPPRRVAARSVVGLALVTVLAGLIGWRHAVIVAAQPGIGTFGAATVTTGSDPLASPDLPDARYVDCRSGHDDGPGSATRPWRSLTPVRGVTLAAGDAVLLRRGCAWTGPLTVNGQGEAGRPVRLGAYGIGTPPVLTGRGLDQQTPVLTIRAPWAEVSQIRVTRAPGYGIQLLAALGTVDRVEVDQVGVGVLIAGPFGLVTGSLLHDLTRVIDAPDDTTGRNRLGGWGVAVAGADSAVRHTACLRCRAGLDAGQDGGFVLVQGSAARTEITDDLTRDVDSFVMTSRSTGDRGATVLIARNRVAGTRRAVADRPGGGPAPAASVEFVDNVVVATGIAPDPVFGPDRTTARGNVVVTSGRVTTPGAVLASQDNTYYLAAPADLGQAPGPGDRVLRLDRADQLAPIAAVP